MRLDFFILADHAERGESTKLNILGGAVTHVKAPSFPHVIPSLALVLRFLYEPGDARTPPPMLRVIVTDPEGQQIAGVGGTLGPPAIERLENLHPDEDSTLVVVGELRGLRIEGEGRYTLRAFLNDAQVGEQAFVAVPES